MPKKRDILKPRPARIIKGKRPPPADLSLIPRLTGETRAINFRCDALTEADIGEHLELLENRAPHVQITLSDALRSLIQEGARSFRERLPEHQPDEETND